MLHSIVLNTQGNPPLLIAKFVCLSDAKYFLEMIEKRGARGYSIISEG